MAKAFASCLGQGGEMAWDLLDFLPISQLVGCNLGCNKSQPVTPIAKLMKVLFNRIADR